MNAPAPLAFDVGFLDRLAAQGSALPPVAGATAVVAVSAAETRSDVPAHHFEVVEGRVVAAGVGARPDATLSVVMTGADIAAFWAGELALDVAFMQGRAKVTGPTGVLVALFEVLRSAAWADLLSAARGPIAP